MLVTISFHDDDEQLGHLIIYDNEANDPNPELVPEAAQWLIDYNLKYSFEGALNSPICVEFPTKLLADLFVMRFERKPFKNTN